MRRCHSRHIREALSSFLETRNVIVNKDGIASLYQHYQISYPPTVQEERKKKYGGKTVSSLCKWTTIGSAPTCIFLQVSFFFFFLFIDPWKVNLLHVFLNSSWLLLLYILPSEHCSLETTNYSYLLNTAHQCS